VNVLVLLFYDQDSLEEEYLLSQRGLFGLNVG